MRLSLEVKNAKLVKKNLQNLHADIPRISEEHIQKAGRRIVRRMQDYPPQRSGSKYIRTYRFKNSWQIKKSSKGITIINKASNRGREYSVYVVGDAKGEGQAWMHVGTWLLLLDVTQYEMTKLPNVVENAIRQSAKGKGF